MLPGIKGKGEFKEFKAFKGLKEIKEFKGLLTVASAERKPATQDTQSAYNCREIF